MGLDGAGAGGNLRRMRTLILMWHAKSSWDDEGLADHERPLNRRGTRDAPRMAAWMMRNDLRPGLVLCSDAVRTRATLTLVLGAVPAWKPQVRFEPRLYLAEPAAMLEVIRRVPDDVESCLVVGHNPGTHALALGLVGSGEPGALADLAMKFPTAAVAVIEIGDAAWRDLRPGKGRLADFVSPKSIPD
jgi:phosphohistidine phosphatase